MKIAIFSDFYYPELSGVSDSIRLLGETLSGRGHKILFVVPHYAKGDYGKSCIVGKEQTTGDSISVKRLFSIPYPFSPTGQGRISLPIGQGVAALKQYKPDMIHTQSAYGPGLEALTAARLFKTPLVGTNHTPVSEFITFGGRWPVHAAERYNAWYYNQCRFVSTPCRSLLNEMRKHGFQAPGIVVPNPINLNRFSPPDNPTEKDRLKRDLGLSKRTVLYTGRLATEKHIDVIIQAVAKAHSEIPDLCLVITGRGRAEASLQELVRNIQVPNHVKFLGFVREDILPNLYKASDLFILMSTAESQSLSLMQAMSSGLPVIGAKARALPEYIRSESGLLVEPGDILGLSKQIVEIFKQPHRAAALGAGGMRAVKQFEASVIAERWEKIYSDTLWAFKADPIGNDVPDRHSRPAC